MQIIDPFAVKEEQPRPEIVDPFAAREEPVKAPQIVDPFAKQERPEDQSFLRQVADVPLQVGQGAIAGVRMLADVFGANNPVSGALKTAENYIGELFSAQSKQDAKEVQRIMDEAKDKGVLDQVKAGLKAIAVAPVDIVSNALGTSAGVVAASLLGGESALAGRLIGAGVGAGMGAGNIKGTIYDAVKEELQKTDMPPEQIEKRAELAQSYGGKNLDMILAGAALGGLGAASGFEKTAAKGIANSILKKEGAVEATEAAAESVAKQELKDIAKRGAVGQGARTGAVEFGTEALEGSQQQLSENVALRREGYDVPLMRGVISQGVLEGIAGFGLGAPTGAIEGKAARDKLAMLAERQLTDNEIKVIEAPLSQAEKDAAGVELDFDYIKGQAAHLVSQGVDPVAAREMAISLATDMANEETELSADAEAKAKGAEDATRPDVAPVGEGTTVAGQPDTEPAPAGVGGAEPSGVVSAGPDVAALEGGAEPQPSALTEGAPSETATPQIVDPFAQGAAETAVPTAATAEPEAQPAAGAVGEELKSQPTEVVAEQVEPIRLEPGEVVEEEPKVETRGRKPLSPEKKAESAEAQKENTKLWKAVNQQVQKATTALTEALTPLDPDNFPDIQQYQEAVESRRIQKIQAIKSLLEQQKLARGKPKLEAAINAALATEGITPKELADVKAGMQRTSKSSTEVKVGRADTRFNKFSNTQQALRHVIQTGNAFQKFLAKRLMPFVKDVTFTVIEEGEAVPDVIREGGAERDWDLARGLFLRETASGKRHIFVRGMSGGPSQGINNVTVLHEALHAALNQKITMGIDALQTGFDRRSDIGRAMQDFLSTMELTRQRVNQLMDEGRLPFFMEDLIDFDKIFEDPKEFLAYAMSDPNFQKFLMQTPGHMQQSLFTRFVNAVRQFFGMAPDTVNALSDIINITDKMLSSRLTPLMQMKVKEERAGAGDAEVSAMAKKNVAKTNKTVEKLEKSFAGTRKQPGIFEAIQELVQTRDSTLLADVLGANWDAWKSGSLRQLLPALQTETVVEWVKNIGKKTGATGWANHIGKAWDLVKDMNGMRVAGTAEAAPISNKLHDLYTRSPEQYRALGNVMHYSTLAKIDPSKDTKSKALTQLWNKLDDDSKKLYEEVREYFLTNYDKYHQLLMDNLAASKIPGTPNDPKTAKGKLMNELKLLYEKGAEKIKAADGTEYRAPYFPLVRYGQYWMRIGKGKSREFYMFESQVERNMFLRQRVREMQAAGDTRTEEEMRKDMDLQDGDNIQDARKDIKDTSALIKSIFEAIEEAAGKPITVTDDFGNQKQQYATIDPEKMKDDVYQLYLHTLPERNFRRQFIHRKGTTGFSYDISRNFATTSTNMINQLARIKYSPAMLNEITAAKDALAGNPDEARLGEFTTEMRFRIENEAYPDPGSPLGHAMADIANKSAFLWLMSTVKTAVAQLSAIPVFAAPVLASKHGTVATAREMGRFMNVFNNFSVMREGKDGTRTMTAPTVADSKNVQLNAEEKRAAQYMIDRGISETTLAYDLGNRRKTPTHVQASTARRVGKAVTDVMTGLFHHSERMIREITFMSSFRLNRIKYPSKSFEEIAQLAEQETYTALGNFASVNRPRGLGATAERQVLLDAHKPMGRAVLQFKMFPAFVTTYFVRNFYRMVAKDMSKQERKEAATQFFGSLTTSFALAGYMGVPGISFAMGIAQGLRNLFRDEDDDDPIEKRDLEFWFRNIWLPQTFGNVKIGDHTLASLMDRGIIAGLTGYDISSSLSLNNMWFPEMKEQATAQATMQDYLLSLGGPFVSLTTNQIPRAVDYFNQGKIMQGMEQLLPGMARTPLTAYRYSQEGATTAAGAVIKEADEYTLGQLVAQGMGFATEGLVAQREAIFKANALMLQVKNEKKQLLNRLDVEIRSDKDMDSIMDSIQRFNYKNPFDPITGDTLRESIKNHLKRRVLTDRGFYMDKKYYPQLMDLIEPSSSRLDIEGRR